MSRKQRLARRTDHARIDPTPPTPGGPPAPFQRIIEIDVIAAFTVLLCLTLAYATRNTLNPDGVSYLDLANAARRNDWSNFVQAYWSPLYPVLLAAAGALTATVERTTFLTVVHLVNALIACAGVGAIWLWSHRLQDRVFARAAMVTFVLAAARPLRIEAVTPDMLLLVLLAWIGYELLCHEGRRWVRLGLLSGFAYLAKTSVWPWLVVVAIVRLALTWKTGARRSVVGTIAVTGLVMAPWVAAMSIHDRGFTVSSAGPLNVCWYLRACDGRTPDTHTGQHRLHQNATLSTGAVVTIASFERDSSWTYLPWSDPTAWTGGIITQGGHHGSLTEFVAYWWKYAIHVIGVWMLPVLAAVLLPVAATHWPKRGSPLIVGERRGPVIVILLGLAGIAQFIVIHAEPRLIAPFVLLFGLAALTWLRQLGGSDESVAPLHRRLRHLASFVGIAVAVVLSIRRVNGELSVSAMVDQRFLVINAQLGASQAAEVRRIAIVGYAVPALSDIWRVNARVVLQVPPRSAVEVGKIPGDGQVAEVRRLLGGRADVAWLVNPDGRFQWVTLTEP